MLNNWGRTKKQQFIALPYYPAPKKPRVFRPAPKASSEMTCFLSCPKKPAEKWYVFYPAPKRAEK